MRLIDRSNANLHLQLNIDLLQTRDTGSDSCLQLIRAADQGMFSELYEYTACWKANFIPESRNTQTRELINIQETCVVSDPYENYIDTTSSACPLPPNQLAHMHLPSW